MTSKTVEYFYDLSSPYAYLAHEAIEQVARDHGAAVRWRPFLLGGLFKSLQIDRAPILGSSANKRQVLLADMFRWAELRGLPFHWPERFPVNSVRPLRVLCQIDGPTHRQAAAALFRAYWGQGTDIGDAGEIAKLLRALDLPADELLAGCEKPEVKQLLIANTAEAFERGMCGAPSFFVGDQLVWGNDRLDHVGRMLDGWMAPAPPA